VANVRGNLVPVVDFGRFLFGERTQHTERTRLLVVRQGGGSVALLVDEVFGQRTVDEEQRREAGREDDPRLARFADSRVGEQQLAVFSMNRLVRAPDFRQAAA
jgi:twitching motility protein PilI